MASIPVISAGAAGAINQQKTSAINKDRFFEVFFAAYTKNMLTLINGLASSGPFTFNGRSIDSSTLGGQAEINFLISMEDAKVNMAQNIQKKQSENYGKLISLIGG